MKTSICTCSKGDSCTYIHHNLPKVGAPGICRFFVAGNCRKGDACEFKHAKDNLKGFVKVYPDSYRKKRLFAMRKDKFKQFDGFDESRRSF